jgi:transcriptional regulator with XRE-family HTH domain
MSEPDVSPIPAEYWQRPVIDDMLSRRNIASILTAIEVDFGLTQEEIGRLAGFSQSRINLWLNGKSQPCLESLEKFASNLDLPPQARYRLGLSSRTEEISNLPDVKLHRLLRLAEHIGRTGDNSLLTNWRELVRPGSPPEPLENLARIIVDRVSQAPVLERMAYRTRGFYLIAAKLPARLVIRALTAHLRDIVLLLDAVEDGERRRTLIVIGGESCYLAACCDVDIGNFAGAQELLDILTIAGTRAGDGALAAMALDGQSHFEAFRGNAERARELVEEARTLCPPETSRGTTAYLWLRTAEVHAGVGDIGQARKAWDLAEAHYAETKLANDRNWLLLWLGWDCFESVRAVIFAATRRPKEAMLWADRVATRLAGHEGKTDAVALMNAALAQARIGLFGNAAQTGLAALHAIRISEASGCLPRAGELAQLLSGFATKVPKAAAYLRELADIGRILSPADSRPEEATQRSQLYRHVIPSRNRPVTVCVAQCIIEP